MKYIKRNIDTELTRWKDDPNRKPLLVRGARQVGKSYSIRHLGNSFKYYIEINLEKRKDLIPLFASSTDVKELTAKLGALFHTPIIEGKTLLFIDEIQFSPEAIGLLRYFKEDYPEMHVAAAGSLLEFALEELPSFGVGRISSLFMYPLSFFEFLGALGKEGWVSEIKSASVDKPIFEALHNDIVNEYRNFILVGGMPASVVDWTENMKYDSCAIAQDEIQQSYFDDFDKYAKKISPDVLRAVLRSVVVQHGKKFVYSKVGEGIREEQTKYALTLLAKAGIIKPIKMTAANGLPLGAEVNEKFTKYLFLDTGLMLRILDLDFGTTDIADQILTAATSDLVNKGPMAEMHAGWEIIKVANPRMKHELFYWENISKGASAEVDYVLPYNMQVLPIEVKSGTSGKMKSLRMFMEAKDLHLAVRTSLENFGLLQLPDSRRIVIIPLYAISRYKSVLYPESQG